MVLMGRFPRDQNGLFDATHIHFFTWDGWVELFNNAGFLIEGVEPYFSDRVSILFGVSKERAEYLVKFTWKVYFASIKKLLERMALILSGIVLSEFNYNPTLVIINF